MINLSFLQWKRIFNVAAKSLPHPTNMQNHKSPHIPPVPDHTRGAK